MERPALQRILEAQKGQFTGCLAPFGYRKDPADKNHLLIDEKAAPIVRQIFGWAMEGHGPNFIRRRLSPRRSSTASRSAPSGTNAPSRSMPARPTTPMARTTAPSTGSSTTCSTSRCWTRFGSAPSCLAGRGTGRTAGQDGLRLYEDRME